MSIHSEVNNLLKNKSGNAKIAYNQRSGERDDGEEYFDTVESKSASAYDLVVAGDELSARKKFLAKYFALLKQWLNRFEWEFVKQLYVEGADENTVYNKLGLNKKRFKPAIASKLASHQSEVQALAEQSEWEDAELFSRAFLASPSAILADKELSKRQPKTVKGFGNLITAQSRREKYLQLESDRYYQRKVYMRGYMAGKYNAEHSGKDLFKKEIQKVVLQVCATGGLFTTEHIKSLMEVVGIDVERDDIARFLQLFDLNSRLFMMCLSELIPLADLDISEERFRRFQGVVIDTKETLQRSLDNETIVYC